MFYNHEKQVYENEIEVPVSHHPIDSINLRDARLGYIDKLNELLEMYEIEQGRIDISLHPSENFAGITVNEYETLLMTHDLPDVLRNPIKFMGAKGKYLLQNPQIIPSRTREYAKYDLVQIFNEIMDTFHFSETTIETILAKFLALRAERFLQVKNSISLLVSNKGGSGPAKVVQGTYQSPILVQWKQSPNRKRRLMLRITRFN
jgi:hypothetical protein